MGQIADIKAGEKVNGFILLHRDLMTKPIWFNSTPEQKVVLITLLTMAAWKRIEWDWYGKKFTLEPGQFITSLPKIAEKCGKEVSIQNVRTALARFKKLEFLTDESTANGRLITITNWRVYQELDGEANRQSNRCLTDGQQTPNRPLTDDQQTHKRTSITSKQSNKENKENKENTIAPLYPPEGETHGLTDQTTNGSQDGLPLNTGAVSSGQTRKEAKQQYAPFVHMQESEYEALIERTGGEAQAKRCIEILDNYKGSTGKKYKDDYRAICSWVLDRLREEQERYSKQRAPGNPQVEMALRAIDMLEGVATNRLDWL